MSELILQTRNLPATLKGLHEYITVNRERMVAAQAALRAMDRLGMTADARSSALEIAQDAAETVLDAEVRVGEIFLQVPKASGGDRKSEDFKKCSGELFEKSKTEMIEESGFSRAQITRFQQLATFPELVSAAKQEARDCESLVTRESVLRKVKDKKKSQNKEEKEQRKEYSLEEQIPDGQCLLFCNDVTTGLNNIEDESIDFIITDPPYPKEYLSLYSNLSEIANRVLRPGGSLIVMTGQTYLPEVIERLAENMTYHWCLSYLTPGGQSPQLFQKNVNTFWKPVLWFVKGKYEGDWIGDVIKSPVNDNDKRYHEWGQSLSGMKDIIERFTNPDDTILDPFLGGGTTGVAAVTMGRKFVGIDIKQENVDISSDRIKEAYAKCVK